VDRGALARVRREAAHWRERLGVARARGRDDLDSAGLVLAFAYPDRVALRRAGGAGRFLLRTGRGAALPSPQALSEAPALVAAALDDQGRESRIFLAAPLELEELARHFAEQVEVETTVVWDERARAVRARRQERLGALVLSEALLSDADPERVLEALLEGIRREGVELLPWSTEARHLQRRTLFLRRLEPEGWPDVSDEALLATLGDWLAPYLYGARGAADLARLDLAAILSARLGYEAQRVLEREAPSHLVVPSGSRIAIDYTDLDAPTLSVRLQEVFGLEETPRIGRGRVPLTLHLLSPARRPVQVTRDLASFWATTYFEVRKDLRGRYPKHYWPDDPREATPTRHVRPR
jgi:ATP-dependent helicase HrpB